MLVCIFALGSASCESDRSKPGTLNAALEPQGMAAPPANAAHQSPEQTSHPERSKAQRAFLENASAHLATLKASLEASRDDSMRSAEAFELFDKVEDDLRVRAVRQILVDAAAAPPGEWAHHERAVNKALMDLENFHRAEQAELLKARMHRVARNSESQVKTRGENR